MKDENATIWDTNPLSVRNLWVEYLGERGMVKAVRGVTFDLRPRESLAFIGESGCGKTTLGLALIRLLVKTARISQGEILYRRSGRETAVLKLKGREMRHFRWCECAMVFQSALNAFNPVLRIRDQMYDTIRAHWRMSQSEMRERALSLLRHVQLDPERVIDSYPHELSGGMRQRVLLAMSLLLDPQIIILDEPTTALDILTQRTILELLKSLKAEMGFSLMFISHDLSIAAELADRVATMYAGAIVELGLVYDIFYRPAHPYTLGLIRAVPTVTGDFQDLISIPGSPPDLIDLPTGCKFHIRCPYATDRCRQEEPTLEPYGPDHSVACFHVDQVRRDADAIWEGTGHVAAGEAA
ncbi:MAG: peptide ABC transporter ATP-binding protein [Anaerolineae bacterium CG2_30_64_16]|nr:MAG: peptide ABC transporter ATP-binding protein [Anaerolineae bacterium CG2_30_64_16]